jgi:DNA invertase Pin-like site-specific DNA recombinase
MLPKNVGIWVRVSTEDQVKGESPEHHERRARFYAESKGWRVSTVFNLDAVSGKSVMGHPETQRMLSEIRAGRISVRSSLAQKSASSTTRVPPTWSSSLKIGDNESIDLQSRGGRLSADIQAVVASDYIRNLREECIKGLYGRLKQGLYPWGAPVGYLNMGKETFETRKRSLLESNASLDEQLSGVTPDLEVERANLLEVFELICTAQQSYRMASVDEKRELVEKLSSNRLVSGNHVLVEPYFPINANATTVLLSCCGESEIRTRDAN